MKAHARVTITGLIVAISFIVMPASQAHIPTQNKLCTTYQIDVWKWDHSLISHPNGTYTVNPITRQDKATLTCLAWIPNWKKFEVDQ
jgi:hypothetical protein